MSTPATYNRVAIGLHWLIALMIIGQLAGGLVMVTMGVSSLTFELYQWHKSFGILILLLSFARLGWRLTHPVPALPAGMKPWEKAAARFTHIGFYVLMIGVPISGWLMVSASTLGIDTVLFKLIPWPHVPGIPQSEALEELFKGGHELLAKLTIGLLVLHLGAALKHHFVNRDDVLTRMIPLLRPRP